MISPSSKIPTVSPKPMPRSKDLHISSLAQKREQKKKSIQRLSSSSDFDVEKNQILNHSRSFIENSIKNMPTRNGKHFTSAIYKSVDNFDRLRFNEEGSASRNNLNNMTTTDIDKVDTIIELPRSPIGRAFHDHSNINLNKFDALIKQYNNASSGLEVIKETIIPTKTKKYNPPKREKVKANGGSHSKSTLLKKSVTKGSMINNRKVLNATFDLINDSPNSIEVRKPPQPYPFVNKTTPEKEKAAEVIQKAWKRFVLKKKKHRRNGSRIPQIKKKGAMSNITNKFNRCLTSKDMPMNYEIIAPNTLKMTNNLIDRNIDCIKHAYDTNKSFTSHSAIPPVSKSHK